MYVYCHILLKHYIIIQYIGKNLKFRKEVILRHVLIGAWTTNQPTDRTTGRREGPKGSNTSYKHQHSREFMYV